MLRGLLRGSTLERVLHGLREGAFAEHTIAATNRRELVLECGGTYALLHYLVADPALHRLVELLVGAPRIESVVGRVYRLVPGAGHVGEFHNDLVGGRVAAFSLSLSEGVLQGGETTVRDAAAKTVKVVAGGPDLRPGDAVILRLRREVEHRVEEVTGSEPKTSFVGFFATGTATSPLIAPRPVGARC